MKIRIVCVSRPDSPALPSSPASPASPRSPAADRHVGVAEQVLPRAWHVDRVVVDAAVDREALVRALVEPADFVAIHVEGDAWTDERKLARQIAWLRGHGEAPGCFHPVAEAEGDGAPSLEKTSEAGGAPASAPEAEADADSFVDRSDADRFELDDLWTIGGLVAPSSLVFRGSALPSVPEWFASPIASLGFSLPILLAAGGALGYLDDELAATAADAANEGDARPGLSPSERELLERRYVNAKLGFRFEASVERFAARQGVELARRCLDAGRVAEARRHWGRAFAVLPFATAFGSGLLPLRLAVGSSR